MEARGSGVCRSLFIRTAPDGEVWEFTGTADGGCALLCGGRVVAAADGTEESVGRLIEEFLRVTAAVEPSPRDADDPMPDAPSANPRAA